MVPVDRVDLQRAVWMRIEAHALGCATRLALSLGDLRVSDFEGSFLCIAVSSCLSHEQPELLLPSPAQRPLESPIFP